MTSRNFLTPDAAAFAEAATLNAPTAKLFPRSWSPHLDVFVMVTRIAERNHLVLHAMRDNAVWSVELDGPVPHPEITSVCWSPDALLIVVAHGGLLLTFHSLHDGHMVHQKSLSLGAPGELDTRNSSVTDMWWIKHETKSRPAAFKDVFDRKEIPGTAHSLLRHLPFIDTVQRAPISLKSEGGPFGARRPGPTTQTTTLPERDPAFIPSLMGDPYAATIAPEHLPPNAYSAGRRPNHQEEVIESMKANSESLLVVGDTTGYLHFFMDGHYSLGAYYMGVECSPSSVYPTPMPSYDPNTENPPDAKIFVFATRPSTNFGQTTNQTAATLQFPLLRLPWTRAIARNSTTIRGLLIYAEAVVKEMRDSWMGSDSREAARSLGAKWLAHLEQLQTAHGDSEAGDGMHDLTTLLLTGRAPHSVREFFSTGGRLSERALTHWEGTMTRALAVLQEYSERKLVPTFERLVILLEEVLGWSMWTQRYKPFHLHEADVAATIKQVHKLVEYAEWLAKAAEEELLRYGEFVRWFRSESLRASDGSGNELRAISFDPLEVLKYLESGFLSSPLDRWFTGDSPPALAPSDVIIRPFKNVSSALETARSFLDKKLPEDRRRKTNSGFGGVAEASDEGSKMDTTTEDVTADHSQAASEISVTEADLDLADSEREAALDRITERNIVLLLEDIVQRCQGIFIPASTTVIRRIEAKTTALIEELSPVTVPTEQHRTAAWVSRERLVVKDGNAILYVALAEYPDASSSSDHIIYFVRIEYSGWALDSAPIAVFGAALDYSKEDSPDVGTENGDDDLVELLDLAFFDDETTVLLVRSEGLGYLVQVMHSSLVFHTLSDRIGPGREEWVARVREAVRNGQIPAQGFASFGAVSGGRGVPARAHALSVCRDMGGGSIAVNGIARREVVCVVDEFGRGQVFDLSRDGDEDEEDGDSED